MLKKGLLTLISIPYSLWLWFWVFAVFTAHFIIISLTAWTKKDPQLYAHKWAQKYLAFGMLMSGTPIDVKGVENIPQGAFVLTSNHQSLFDTALHVIQMSRAFALHTKTRTHKNSNIRMGYQNARSRQH